MSSPRLTLRGAALSSPRVSQVGDGAPASPKTGSKIFATLRGSPRNSPVLQGRLITIDAPLFPILLVDQSNSQDISQYVWSNCSLLIAFRASFFTKPGDQPQEQRTDTKTVESVWSNFAQSRFAVQSKGKRAAEVLKLMTYSEVTIIDLLHVSN